MLAVLVIAIAAALAAVLGGLLAAWRRPTTLIASLVLGFAGGGAMLYLTVTDLVPGAEAQHYQQSSALATAIGGSGTWWSSIRAQQFPRDADQSASAEDRKGYAAPCHQGWLGCGITPNQMEPVGAKRGPRAA